MLSRNIKSLIDSSFSKAKSIMVIVIREMMLVVPFLIFFTIAQQFFMETGLLKLPAERYYILFISVGLCATVAGLSFRAGQVAQDEKKRKLFIDGGERMFHATILFCVSIVLEYCGKLIDQDKIGPLIAFVLSSVIIIPKAIFQILGLTYITSSLIKLHKELIVDHEIPFDIR